MKRFFAPLAAACMVMGALPAAADEPASFEQDLQAMPRLLTDAYCAYRDQDRSGQLCRNDLDRARVRHLFDQAVAAAAAGNVPRSLLFYSVPKAEILAVVPDNDTDFFDLRLAVAGTHGLCAQRLREGGDACTPAEAAALRQRLRRVYTAGRLNDTDLLPTPAPRR